MEGAAFICVCPQTSNSIPRRPSILKYTSSWPQSEHKRCMRATMSMGIIALDAEVCVKSFGGIPHGAQTGTSQTQTRHLREHQSKNESSDTG